MTTIRPYVDAGTAAALLGVDRHVVVADVLLGMAGNLEFLVGEKNPVNSICVVSRWELEGPRLEMHRAGLGQLQGESSAVCNTVTSSAVP